jgi:putative hydrolase of the HAD superfamily
MDAFRTVEAVFFDLDDTLCAYWDASKIGLRKAFEQHGPPDFTVEEMIDRWAAVFRVFSPTVKDSDWYKDYLKTGEPTRVEQMRRTLLELGVDDPGRAAQLSQTYFEERDRHLELFPDAIEVLEVFQKRYALGLITNGPADVQRQEVATLGIEKYFDHILIEGEMGHGKPLEQVFRRAEELVRKQPEEILFVGNSYAHDVKPAIAAGWRSVWVRRPSDVPPSSDLTMPEPIPEGEPQPDATIGHLKELFELLGIEGD